MTRVAAAAKLGGPGRQGSRTCWKLPKSKGVLDSLLGDTGDASLASAAAGDQEGAGTGEQACAMWMACCTCGREPVWAVLPFRVEVK